MPTGSKVHLPVGIASPGAYREPGEL